MYRSQPAGNAQVHPAGTDDRRRPQEFPEGDQASAGKNHGCVMLTWILLLKSDSQ